MTKRNQRPTKNSTSKPNPRPGKPPSDSVAERATPDHSMKGLDAAEHAAAQRHAEQAESLRERIFPALMAWALPFRRSIDPGAYKVYLDQLLEDAGNPKDPIERMMIEQLALTHFRIGLLHTDAAEAKGIEAVKVYNSVVARMQGEFRRSALALRVYRGRAPESADDSKLKLFKAAQ
jgi:hypothetical protein